jgi:magnesium-transporting ATPase (P-type)
MNIKNREKVEHDLIFLGLVIMENRLKPQTEGTEKPIIDSFVLIENLHLGVLKILSNANIRTIMCTGMFYNFSSN